MKLVIDGDEYTATKSTWTHGTTPATNTGTNTYTFSNVEIEKSGKFQIFIDVDSDATQKATITFDPVSINSKAISGTEARYTDARRSVKPSEVKGSVSFTSRVTIQPSKASLVNDLTKRVEFTTNDGTKKVVFDGSYTAKKGDVYLNTAEITASGTLIAPIKNDTTFYLYIDGDEVATMDPNKTETFTDILVKNGESVKVKVEAEISTDVASGTVYQFELNVSGDDENGNSNAGAAKKSLVDIKVVEKGTFNIAEKGKNRNTVLLRGKASIAQFTIKPSNNSEGLKLEDLYISGYIGNTKITPNDIRLEIDGVAFESADDADTQWTSTGLLYEINEDLPSAGVTAEIFLETEANTGVVIEVANMNGLRQGKTFKKYFAEALVYITSQQNQDSFTQYFL
jgi:hypothetical protein